MLRHMLQMVRVYVLSTCFDDFICIVCDQILQGIFSVKNLKKVELSQDFLFFPLAAVFKSSFQMSTYFVA